MDIYADLPSANTTSSSSGSSGSSSTPSASSAVSKGSWAHSKFQGMIAKRRTVTAASSRMAPPPLLKRPGVPTAVVVRAKDKVESIGSKTKPATQSSSATSPASGPKSWDMGFGDVEDDYDPFHPNDYMDYCRERVNKKKQEEHDRELKIIMEEQERERKRQDEERAATIRKIQEAAAKAHEAGTGVGGLGGVGAGRGGGAGGAGATSGAAAAAAAVGGDIAALEVSIGRGRGRGLSNLPAWMTKGQGPGPGGAGKEGSSGDELQEPPTPGRRVPPPTPGQFENASEGGPMGPPGRGVAAGGAGAGVGGNRQGVSESGMNFAERMMAKMGHKEGQGLGASRQGISQPLQSMSAGGGMGVIEMHHADKKRMGGAMEAPPVPPTRKKRGLFSNPTRVLLLKNMVGPGEVDEDLEGETQGECERFGPVRQCLIYEMKGGDTPDSERVRIFVAFEKQESAVKAYLEMNGRFFGGRQIAASFYKEDRFDALNLEPQPDEEKS